MIEKVVADSGNECQHSGSILSDQQNNKVKPAVVRKKLVKKSLKKTYPVHTSNGKSKASYDRLSNSICKKAKINGKLSYSSVQSENDCDASSSVPSLASNLSGDGKINDEIISRVVCFHKNPLIFFQSWTHQKLFISQLMRNHALTLLKKNVMQMKMFHQVFPVTKQMFFNLPYAFPLSLVSLPT